MQKASDVWEKWAKRARSHSAAEALAIAGLDDSHWDEEGQRSFHVNQGGRFMHEFAVGLSEEGCDRIANSEAALAS